MHKLIFFNLLKDLAIQAQINQKSVVILPKKISFFCIQNSFTLTEIYERISDKELLDQGFQ